MVKYDKFAKLAVRLRTFASGNWQKESPSAETLAVNGFFFLGGTDVVQCYQCGMVLHTWKADDVVPVEHFKHSPSCSIAFEAINTVGQCKGLMIDILGKLKSVQNELHILEVKQKGPRWEEGVDEVDDTKDVLMACGIENTSLEKSL